MTKNIRLVSLGFRSTALAAKFGLFVVLAIFLEPSEVGLFGLAAATINLSLYFLGLDFYIYANREFRVADPAEKARILAQNARVFCLTYLVFLPLYLVLFAAGVLPWHLFAFVVALSILEHLSTELYRLLIIYGRQGWASFCFFLRLGFWPIVAGSAMWLEPGVRTLDAVMGFWLAGAVLSIVLPVLFVVKWPRSMSFPPLDTSWILAGFKIALPFLVGTLCLRAIQTLDRYFFEGLVGADILGAYVFFVGIASVLPAMLQAGVYAFTLPNLISAAHDRDWGEYSRLRHELRLGIIFGSVALSLLAMLGSWVVLHFIERPVYADNFALLFLALAANIIFAVSMYFHLPLHALREDAALSKSHVGGLVGFLVACAALAPVAPYWAIPVAVMAGNGVILAMKYRAYKQHAPTAKAWDEFSPQGVDPS